MFYLFNYLFIKEFSMTQVNTQGNNTANAVGITINSGQVAVGKLISQLGNPFPTHLPTGVGERDWSAGRAVGDKGHNGGQNFNRSRCDLERCSAQGCC